MRNDKFTYTDKVFQNISLLTLNEDFINDVIKLRKRWKKLIPKDISGSTEFIFKKEEPAIEINLFDEIFDGHKLRKSKSPLKNEMSDILSNIFSAKPDNNKKTKFPVFFDGDIPKLDKDINKLRISYGLTKPHQEILRYFVLYNRINTNLFFIIESAHIYFDSKKDGERSMAIRIFPDTSIKDIKEIWESMDYIRKKYFKYRKLRQCKRPNLIRDLKVKKLRDEKKSYIEIRNIINSEFPNQQIDYQDVPKIIERLRIK